MHNPRTVQRWALGLMYTTMPASTLLLLAWAFKLHKEVGARPHLVTMTFMLLVMLAAVGGLVAALASCHIATHRAFTAGYTAGATNTAERVGIERAKPHPADQRPDLQVVGDRST